MGEKGEIMLFKNSKIDLHIHTCFSDGGLLPSEIFKQLHKNKIKIAAITDHNNIDAYSTLKDINTYDIKIVLGIEIDVVFEQNIYHILMYNFDTKNEYLLQYLEQSKQHDINEFYKMIAQLKDKFKLQISQKQIQDFVLKNQYFDKVRLNNFLVECGYSQNPQQAFYDYTKDITDKKRYCISAKHIFELASKCGATTSMAHPHKYLRFLKNQSHLHNVILEMQKMGLDAIEVYNNRQNKTQQTVLKKFAKKHGFMITGGSDFHQKLGCCENKNLAMVLGKHLKQSKISKKIYKNKKNI